MQVGVIGGTGFVGSYLVDALLVSGHEVSLLVREGSERKVHQTGRVRSVAGDVFSSDAIRVALQGCDAVIYNIGILRESRGVTFEATQYDGLVNTVDVARESGVSRLLLMSSNGVKQPGTPYQETKHRAEQYASQSGLDVTVLRPSVIFGDPRGTMEFATQLANEMVRPPFPAVSIFSGRDPKKGAVVMSPVHVEDVASAFVASLESEAAIGETYILGGPDVLSWPEMISTIASVLGKTKWMLPMPIWIMRLGATLFDWLPFFPITRGQLKMLEEGNTADPASLRSLIAREPRAFNAESLAYLA